MIPSLSVDQLLKYTVVIVHFPVVLRVRRGRGFRRERGVPRRDLGVGTLQGNLNKMSQIGFGALYRAEVWTGRTDGSISVKVVRPCEAPNAGENRGGWSKPSSEMCIFGLEMPGTL